MNRLKLLKKAYERKEHLSVKNKEYRDFLDLFIKLEEKADFGNKGDITAKAILKDDSAVTSIIEAKEDGVIAGVEEVVYLYKKNNVKVKACKKDGDNVKKGQKILELRAKEGSLLKTERIALNILQRMSGIATLSREMSRIASMPICPTRKTVMGYLDRKAASVGCGFAHRLGLWESFLIKKNYIKSLAHNGVKNPIEYSIEAAWKKRKESYYINIEVEGDEDVLRAALKFRELNNKKDYPCIIMLDNFSPQGIMDTVNKMKHCGLYDYVLFEASGGIKPEKICDYRGCGADILSIGCLTHSAGAVDMRQVVIR